MEGAISIKSHNRSKASVGSSEPIFSTIIAAWVSSSLINALRLRQPTKLVDRRMDVKRLRTSRDNSSAPRLWLSSSRKRRLMTALPMLTSIKRWARRSAPSAARFSSLRVFFDMRPFWHWEGRKRRGFRRGDKSFAGKRKKRPKRRFYSKPKKAI